MDKNVSHEIRALDSRLRAMLAKVSTFVSIDMVESTALKINEAEEDVIFSFLAYQKMVTGIVEGHKGQVVSVTGDGVMARFVLSRDAVEAVMDLLRQLPEFNQNMNLLKSPWKIRIGVNTGRVFEDSQQELASRQLMPSRVIDIAGYLQKYAPPDTAWLSQFTIEDLGAALPGIAKDHYDEKIGFMIYVYRSDRTVAHQARQRFQKPKVLIVEDEPDLAFDLAKFFHETHYETDIAFDGMDGLIHIRTFEPDMMLLDIGLPRMDGWHVLHEMKANKLAPRLPILMLSRRYSMSDIERSFEMGASGCLRKPCDISRLMRKVQALLD